MSRKIPLVTAMRTVRIWARILPRGTGRRQTMFIQAHRTKKLALKHQRRGEIVMCMKGHYWPSEAKP